MINYDSLLPAYFDIYQYPDYKDVYEIRTIYTYRNRFKQISVYLEYRDKLIVSDAGGLLDVILDLDFNHEQASEFIKVNMTSGVCYDDGVLHIDIKDEKELREAFSLLIQNIISINNRAYEVSNQPSYLDDIDDEEVYYD